MVTPTEVFIYLIASIVGTGLGMLACFVLISILLGEFRLSDLKKYCILVLSCRKGK